LMRITVHKTLRQVAFHKAAKRDPNMEMGQQEAASEQVRELLDREPTPEATVAFVDQLEHFLARLGTEERQVLEMRLQGYSNEEIATSLGIYDRKIRRLLERIRGLAELEGLTALAGVRRASARGQAAQAKEEEAPKSEVRPAESVNGEAKPHDDPPPSV
jgi:hypothetical protein